MWPNTLILSAFVPFFVICVEPEPGPKYKATKGEVWPKAQYETKNYTYYVLNSCEAFYVTTPYYTCDVVTKAIERLLYRRLTQKYQLVVDKTNKSKCGNRDEYYGGTIGSTEFRIDLKEECEKYPFYEMIESYKLVVKKDLILLTSVSIWGILRGLQTFSHLLYYSEDYSEIRINTTKICDFPAYSYRGLLIDTARHFLSLNTIFKIIDGMEMDKLNVLHWHIVDDQSFPYESERFPNLSKKGAYHSSMVYTKKDIKRVIEYGRLAGIRIIPEFDVPGHTRSWGEGHPEILTKCYTKKKEVGLGPLNPIKNETYTFLRQLFEEVVGLFPDAFIHLGGDEVDSNCWMSNPEIIAYMKENNLNKSTALHTLFMTKVKSLLPPKSSYILWQEVFDTDVPLPKKTILQVWKYHWTDEMIKIIEANKCVIFSSSWYLDEIFKTWEAFYSADPRSMVYSNTLNAASLHNIVGGEVCMWGEKVDDSNILSRTWPRTSAVAERLWSGVDFKTFNSKHAVTDHVRRRIEEHVSRLHSIGITTGPLNGPSMCVGNAYTLAFILAFKPAFTPAGV